jgi:SpoVK/Ycf46/Vps4 family AAA+-type ATPase
MEEFDKYISSPNPDRQKTLELFYSWINIHTALNHDTEDKICQSAIIRHVYEALVSIPPRIYFLMDSEQFCRTAACKALKLSIRDTGNLLPELPEWGRFFMYILFLMSFENVKYRDMIILSENAWRNVVCV